MGNAITTMFKCCATKAKEEIDTDHDGKISPQEAVAAVQTAATELDKLTSPDPKANPDSAGESAMIKKNSPR